MYRFMKNVVVAVSLCFVGAGCTAEGSLSIPSPAPAPPPASTSTGTLTQRWSIGGSFDSNLCATYGADRMELVISDTAGRQVARAYQPCNEMRMTLTLAVGSYVADAVLIDRNNREVSTTLPLQPFSILNGIDTFVDTDFPTSSMLNVLSATGLSVPGEIDDESD